MQIMYGSSFWLCWYTNCACIKHKYNNNNNNKLNRIIRVSIARAYSHSTANARIPNAIKMRMLCGNNVYKCDLFLWPCATVNGANIEEIDACFSDPIYRKRIVILVAVMHITKIEIQWMYVLFSDILANFHIANSLHRMFNEESCCYFPRKLTINRGRHKQNLLLRVSGNVGYYLARSLAIFR